MAVFERTGASTDPARLGVFSPPPQEEPAPASAPAAPAREEPDRMVEIGRAIGRTLRTVGGDVLRARGLENTAQMLDPRAPARELREIGAREKLIEYDPATGQTTTIMEPEPEAEASALLGKNVVDLSLPEGDVRRTFAVDESNLDFVRALLQKDPRRFKIERGPAPTATASIVGPLQPATKTELEKKFISDLEILDTVQALDAAFDPSFLTYFGAGGKIETSILGFLSRVPIQFSPEARERLVRASTFQQFANQLVNETIKAITGAQMSEAEALRIKAQIPDPSDDPVTFQTQLENMNAMLVLSALRAQALRKQGIDKDFDQYLSLRTLRDQIRSEHREVFAAVAGELGDAAAVQQADAVIRQRYRGLKMGVLERLGPTYFVEGSGGGR